MNQTFLLTLTPGEPYFFGSENAFTVDLSHLRPSNFEKSERLPLQTGLLGTMRYLLLPVKREDFRYTPQEQARNTKIVGNESFRFSKSDQTFGAIVSISPLFLTKGADKFVPTPFDHDTTVATHYTPLSNPREAKTADGIKWYFPQFRGKDGITDSYMNVKTGQLVSAKDIFFSSTRLQIRTDLGDTRYHRRRLVHLREGWSMAAYVTLDMELLHSDPAAVSALDELFNGTLAFMGQSKGVFTARLKAEENQLPALICQHLRPGVVYCLGDTLAPAELYDHCYFAATQLRDYRALHTTFLYNKNQDRYAGWMSKGTNIHRLLQAGSVLIPRPEENIDALLSRPGCQKIGLNITISHGEEA